MNLRHTLRPDLAASVLEDRTLPASFIDSTFFQFSLTSGTSPFQLFAPAGVNALALTDPGLGLGGLDMSLGGSTDSADSYVYNNPAGSSYYGFGSNPLGSGLSPLGGVVEAYSMNTALSNILGGGSSIPGDGSLGDGFNPSVPGGNAALRAGAVGGPINVSTAPGDLNGPRGYGSAVSSGFNVSLTSANNYGMGTRGIGTMSASALLGYGSDEEPNRGAAGPGRRGANSLPGPTRNRLGEGPINDQVKKAPSRRDPTPSRNDLAPAEQQNVPTHPQFPPVPGRGTDLVPTGPTQTAPRDRRDPGPVQKPGDAPPPPNVPESLGEALFESVLQGLALSRTVISGHANG